MKVKIVGRQGCSRCNVVKNLLDANNIRYEYFNLSNMNIEKQREILTEAKDNDVLTLPIINVNGKFKTNVQEVLELCK